MVNPTKVKNSIRFHNVKKADEYLATARSNKLENELWRLLYTDVFVPRSRELEDLGIAKPTPSLSDLPKGRQTGSATWTQARDEDG